MKLYISVAARNPQFEKSMRRVRPQLDGNRPSVPLLASLALGAQAIFSAGGGDRFRCALKAAAQTEGRSCSSADSSAGLINGRRLKTSCR